MTSLRQIEANRRNSLKSTGPRTQEGKRRSRRNALRHGLTAETVIEIFEDVEDYKAFEAAVIVDFDAHTAVQRELALRLASLLWRLRRATSIETDLMRIHAEILHEGCDPSDGDSAARAHSSTPQPGSGDGAFVGDDQRVLSGTRGLSYSFLRLASCDHGVFERLSRYEAALWRQAVQTLAALQAIRRIAPRFRSAPAFESRYPWSQE